MTGSAATRFGRLLGEPLLHFFVLGAGLFALFSALNGPAAPAGDEVVVSEARAADLAGQFQRVWQRPPTQAELSGLVESWVREEILYREGLALGLDRDDPVLRRRIAQKMTFISEDLLTEEPTEADLRAWLADHADDYRIDPVFTFRQVYVAADDPVGDVETRIAGILEALEAGAEPATQGDATLLPAGLERASQREVARSFGSDFAAALATAPRDAWYGPIRSGYGLHLVRISLAEPGRLPTLAEVRAAVLRDLRHARAQQANEAFYQRLLERYEVRYEFAAGAAPDAETGRRSPVAAAAESGRP